MARTFVIDAFHEYCLRLREARASAAEIRYTHAVMSEEFNCLDGWQKSPAVCVLMPGRKDRWSVLSEGGPAHINCTGLTRSAMRVIAEQVRMLNRPVPSPPNYQENFSRREFRARLDYADTIDAAPVPVIPDFPRRFLAARKAFKDWSWV